MMCMRYTSHRGSFVLPSSLLLPFTSGGGSRVCNSRLSHCWQFNSRLAIQLQSSFPVKSCILSQHCDTNSKTYCALPSLRAVSQCFNSYLQHDSVPPVRGGESARLRVVASQPERQVSVIRESLSMARPLAGSSTSEEPRVLSIQSHTVQGYVGNKAAVFPLQLLGFDVDPINSVHFSNHTGYPKIRGQVLNGEQLWDVIEGLEANELLYYTHLLTGYIGSISFLEMIVQVVEKLRSVNPDLIFVCDPVMGDEGKLYVPPELVPAYRDKVIPLATFVTPNQFETELLTGCKIQTEAEALEAIDVLHAAGPSKVVITSLDVHHNLLVLGSQQQSKGETQQFKITMEKIPGYFTGTGDLMSALLLGWSYKYPHDLAKAAELAVASLQAVLKRTVRDYEKAAVDPNSNQLELRLIQSQSDIKSPQVTLFAEKL